MQDEPDNFSYEYRGVKYYQHQCRNCPRVFTDHWRTNLYCGLRECRRRSAGL